MAKKLKWGNIAPLGAIIGHTEENPVNGVREIPIKLPGLEPGTRAFRIGPCTVLVSQSQYGWHISISHPRRYPTWDEVAKARYALIPGDITMAMMLPPQREFINIHTNCFQLWEVRDIHNQTVIELGETA